MSRYIPLILVFLCLVVQIIHITTFPVQHDEPFSIFTSNLEWSEFWNIFMHENNPPLHPFLLKLVIETVGLDFFYMRLLSVIFSTSAVYFIYKSGKLLSESKTGLIASLMYIFSNLQLMYAHQIRAYALLVFLASVSLYLFVLIIRHKGKTNYLWLGIINGLMLYTHFMGIVYVCFLSISLLIYFQEKTIIKTLLFSFLITFIMFTPYLPVFLNRLDSAQNTGWLDSPSGIMAIYYTYWKFFNVPLLTIISIAVVLSSVYFIVVKNNLQKEIGLLLSLVISTFFGLFFSSSYLPVYLERYLLFIAPILYILISITIVNWSKYIPNINLQTISILVVPIIFLLSFNIKSDINKSEDNRWEEIEMIKENKIVVFSPYWLKKDLSYCYYKDKEKLFQSTKKDFITVKNQNNIYTDDNFLRKKDFTKEQNILISSKEFSGELKQLLENKFVLVQKISDCLYEYRLK